MTTTDRSGLVRYVIQVVYPSGDTAYLRHGSRVGEGAIVRFRDRRTAEINLDFITQGLDRGISASVVRYTKDME